MITIKYNESEEMMEVFNNGRSVFYGNYWDFHNDPHYLRQFLEKLELDVELKNVDYEDCEDEEEDYRYNDEEEWDN